MRFIMSPAPSTGRGPGTQCRKQAVSQQAWSGADNHPRRLGSPRLFPRPGLPRALERRQDKLLDQVGCTGRSIRCLERGVGRANDKAASSGGEGAEGSGRGVELSAVLNRTGQARGERSRLRSLLPTRFLDLNFCPSTAAAASLPVAF